MQGNFDMATAYVITAEADVPFVKGRILINLPMNGYHHWLSRMHFEEGELESFGIAGTIDQCDVILVVLSPSILQSPAAIHELEVALADDLMLIVVQSVALEEEAKALLPDQLWNIQAIDFSIDQEAGEESQRTLVSLLPPVDVGLESDVFKQAELIEWNSDLFSAALEQATTRHDFSKMRSLVAAFTTHLNLSAGVYSSEHASKDLHVLRQQREFELMCRYAEAVQAAGVTKDTVQRLFAQALIETEQYDAALSVLQSIINKPDSSHEEIFEAQGLIGRTYKQRYVNDPGSDEAEECLKRAIEAYENAYLEDQKNFWHGVNAASCMVRAERNGIRVTEPLRPQEIAAQIIEYLDQPSGVWGCASLVEALLVMARYDEADRALDAYINHPNMTAFEVSSTFRQFDQVLQLERHPKGEKILGRLRHAMERYRAGNVQFEPFPSKLDGAESVSEAVDLKSLVIRVNESDWEPHNIDDLIIHSRLGNIITARGSVQSIRHLLEDLSVISVEESRPVGRTECNDSMPFVKATGEYTGVEGTFTETGDKALIAIIDDGIDIFHKAFLDAKGKSRIIGVWDQVDNSGKRPSGFDYGTFHDEASIAKYIKSGVSPPGLRRHGAMHGTHVASIAGGRGVGQFKGGVAPDAKLLIIASAHDGPIGYSRSHIEALDFIDQQAKKLNMPVVVNVSQGMNAGAHDGKSSLEAAFDAFSGSGRKRGRVVVKSAGNERQNAGHAWVTLPPNSIESLRWRPANRKGYTERIELWWKSEDDIQFRLRDPAKNWTDWVGTESPECKGTFPDGGGYELSFTKYHVDNGDSYLLIELGNYTDDAIHGNWMLEMRSGEIFQGGKIHCWIERNFGIATRFLDHLNEDVTLSIPGTAQSVIAVGAVKAAFPLRVGEFSSYGPTRDCQKKPLVCAPGVEVHGAKAGTEEDVVKMSGTSMAAPHVAGAIALALSRTTKLRKVYGSNQIAAILRRTTQNYSGRWDRGQGYGVVDVAAFLARFG